MAKTVEDALRSLDDTIVRQGLGAVRDVETSISGVMQFADAQCIVPLLLHLDDTAPYDEVMFSLIHAAESFDDSTYVRSLLDALPKLVQAAPKWASIALMRVLNNASSKAALVQALSAASPDAKHAVTWLCEKLNERSASFIEKTLAVSLAAKN
ncbi:Imm30 family immunity protein [Burkholderia contaminans]|uniref:Imm30 family immunity protein n=1 Tax=Burkholderia contaminans TaxID=488447 RepID=UPI0015828D15|nr:Imm30 family immunity protein [Burkholderia contaminans]